MFKVDERIENDSVWIGDLTLSQLRLYRDGDLTWFILVPRKEGAIEWMDLSVEEQAALNEEITLLSRKISEVDRPDKINIASLGNMVPQLHIHVIARFKTDRAWPGAIWGTSPIESFDENKVTFWKDKVFAES